MRCDPSDRRRLFAVALLSSGLYACGGPAADNRPAPGPPANSASSVPHGDHNPHHGGIVMMKGEDLHYEVVLDPAGRSHGVYFTDALREDLPASVASNVELTIKRSGSADEHVALQIDAAGESWVGSGQPIANPETTTVRVGFSIRNEPYWIDLPVKK